MSRERGNCLPIRENLSEIHIFLIGIIGLLLAITIPPQIATANPSESVKRLHHSFDEGSGQTVLDQSIYGNNGSLLPEDNGPTWSKGVENYALKFDGKEDYVKIPHSQSLKIENEITASAWVKVPSDVSGWQGIVTKGGTSKDWFLQHGADGSPQFRANIGGERYVVADRSIDIRDNKWHHLTGVFDGNKLSIFLDGRLAETKDVPNGKIDTSTTPIYLGRRARNGNLKGMIDGVRIYSKALSLPLISTLSITEKDIRTQDSVNDLSIKFNGQGEYIQIPNNPTLDSTREITVSHWIKTEIKGFWQVSLRKLGQCSLQQRVNGTARGDIRIQEKRYNVGANKHEINDGEWHHQVLTYDGTTLKLYVDGELDDKLKIQGEIDNSNNPLTLASSSQKLGRWMGKMDEVRIYGRALSQIEIQNLYQGKAIQNNLISYWSFDGAGSKIEDEGPNSNTGIFRSDIRAKENLNLEFVIQNSGEEPLEQIESLQFEAYIDNRKIGTENLTTLELEPKENYRIEFPWQPKKLGKHAITGIIKSGIYSDNLSKQIEVKPPVNPPIKTLQTIGSETENGLSLTLNPESIWNYQGEKWTETGEIEILRRRLLKDESAYSGTYLIDNNTRKLELPYDSFYKGDGIYEVKLSFMNSENTITIKVSGEDGEYDPPNDLLWIVSLIAVSLVLGATYLYKKSSS